MAWFAFGVCFFGAASLPLDEEVFNQDLLATPTRAQIAESNFIPLLIAMVLCYAMIKLPDSCGTYTVRCLMHSYSPRRLPYPAPTLFNFTKFGLSPSTSAYFCSECFVLYEFEH